MNRPPTHPGEILAEDFLRPQGMTQTKLAARLGWKVQQVNALVRRRRAVTAKTAILLSRVFDTSPEFWMNLQIARDLWFARQA